MPTDTIDTLRFEGLKWAESGDISRAIDLFKQALQLNPRDAHLHNNIANAYKRQLAFDKAIQHYRKAIEIDTNYAQAHNNLANLLIHQQHYNSALYHYRCAVHAAPDFTLAHYHLGLLLIRLNEKEAAKIQFNNVIELNPQHLQAHFYRAILALDHQELEEAEKAFQHVLDLDAEHVDTLVNLGVIALKRDQGQIAIDYFTKALALDPEHVEARNNMAATFIHHDRFENALTHYAVLLEKDPEDLEYRYNTGVAEMALGHLNKALTHFETLLRASPHHFEALINSAAIHTRLNKRHLAITLLQQAHRINPNDSACQFMLNALTNQTSAINACPEYTQNLFNSYALYYDQHMQNTLHYAIPQHIEEELRTCTGISWPVERTLDLGCGTGLSGVVLQAFSEHLTGVDLSFKMLQQAKTKQVYDEVVESEIIAFLTRETSSYNIIVSADVLPYLGELDTLFQAIRARLTPSGVFIFNIEISSQESWMLQENARFCHHPDYILSLMTRYQFKLLQQKYVVARQQNDQNLTVLLYILQLTA
jgi:predicted TPR repeat methyltransferase